MPEAFDKLNVPNFIQIDPKEINKNKEKWIDEWLNAS
jgi:ABC-type thiamine transport system substrate-binding protein